MKHHIKYFFRWKCHFKHTRVNIKLSLHHNLTFVHVIYTDTKNWFLDKYLLNDTLGICTIGTYFIHQYHSLEIERLLPAKIYILKGLCTYGTFPQLVCSAGNIFNITVHVHVVFLRKYQLDIFP